MNSFVFDLERKKIISIVGVQNYDVYVLEKMYQWGMVYGEGSTSGKASGVIGEIV